MAKLAEQLERKAFSAAIDVALRRINKDREKGLLEIVDLTELYQRSIRRCTCNDQESGSQMDALCKPSVR